MIIADAARWLSRRIHQEQARRLYALDHAHERDGSRMPLDSGPYDIEARRAGWSR